VSFRSPGEAHEFAILADRGVMVKKNPTEGLSGKETTRPSD
jgi:hypothetical protein